MALFWFLAGCLGALALVLVLLPLLRAIPSLNAVPAGLSVTLSIIAIVLAASLGFYVHRVGPGLQMAPPVVGAGSHAAGAPAMRSVGSPGTSTAPAAAASTAGGSMDAAIASLEGKLAKGGGSPDEWELLAKSYEFLGRPDDARMARAHQLPTHAGAPAMPAQMAAPPSSAPSPKLTPESAKLLQQAASARAQHQYQKAVGIYARLADQNQLGADGWADYADAAASINGGKLSGVPEGYADRALAIDPGHTKALWLKASAAEEQGRWGDAVQYWQRLGAVLDPASDDARIVGDNLRQAQQRAGLAPEGSATAQGAAGVSISGDVALSKALRDRVAPDAVLFIVAKSADSPGPPVAVIRQSAGQWPARFTLDDSQAMVPGRNLSSARHVTVEARLSRSGQAMPASGDLKGTSAVIDPHVSAPLHVVIDQVVP